MSDDPCECVFSHEAMMRRLLSILRQSQEECTDENCNSDGTISGNNTMMMMALMGIFAVMMFMARPDSLRLRPNNTDGKPSGGADRDPPPPPPSLT